MVYVENRRFLPQDHALRRRKKHFPDNKLEKRAPPEQVTIEDVLWNSVAHNRAKNKAQASNVMKATGSRGVNCFMLLPDHDRPNQAFPDIMHDLKNIVCVFFDLFTGKGDGAKVRNAEKSLGRFKGCWPVKAKCSDKPDEQEQEQATNGRVLLWLLRSKFLQMFYKLKLYTFGGVSRKNSVARPGQIVDTFGNPFINMCCDTVPLRQNYDNFSYCINNVLIKSCIN